MKSKKFIYLLALVGLTFASCEKDQPEVKVSPVYPLSGEYYVHVYNNDGSAARATYTTLSIYNTSENVNNIVWMKMLTSAVPYGLLGKVGCDVNAKTISGAGTNTAFVPNKNFNVLEGKVLLNATTLKGSKTVADSIYVKFTTDTDGKTYILSGHRRSQYEEDQY